jgi:hypothetical protein
MDKIGIMIEYEQHDAISKESCERQCFGGGHIVFLHHQIDEKQDGKI